MQTFLWATLTVITVCITLFFGLRLRGRGSSNDVEWLADKRALRFHSAGIAYVDDLRAIRHRRHAQPLTIAMAFTSGSKQRQGFSPLLILHDGEDRRQVAVWQYATSLVVMNGDDYDYRRRWPRATGKNVVQPETPHYLSITSHADNGTRVYIDGRLVAENREWSLSIPRQGERLRLAVGNSVYGNHGWIGDIFGLAILDEALTADRVKDCYAQWSRDRRFDFFLHQSPLLLYTFDRRDGTRFTDYGSAKADLVIPPQVITLKRTILALPEPYFRMSRAAAADMLINTIGFIPLGAVLAVLLCTAAGCGSRQKWTALALCLLVSLGIELAQAWIPTRYSTMLDLILNTAGAWIGIELGRLFAGRTQQRPV